MYLIYIDESGTSIFGDKNDYVISALIIQEKQWKIINEKIQNLQKKITKSINIDFLEFHTSEIAYFQGNYYGLKKEQRIKLLYDLAEIIHLSKCYLISIVIQKDRIIATNRNSEWVEEWCWRLLFERLEKFLYTKNKKKLNEFGLICMDARDSSSNEKINKLMKSFVAEGSMYVHSKYLIEDIFFVDSEFRNLIQLVDFVAWISRKYLFQIKEEVSKNSEDYVFDCFELIKNKFDKDSSGSIFGAGLKIHP